MTGIPKRRGNGPHAPFPDKREDLPPIMNASFRHYPATSALSLKTGNHLPLKDGTSDLAPSFGRWKTGRICSFLTKSFQLRKYPLPQRLLVFVKKEGLGRMFAALPGIFPGLLLELFVVQFMQHRKRLHQRDVDSQNTALIPHDGEKISENKFPTVKGGTQTLSCLISILRGSRA